MCGNFAERHNFRIVSGELPKTMLKLCLSTNFSHHEIRWNYSISRSDILKIFDILPIFLLPQVKWRVIISNNSDIHQMPHKLPNKLRQDFRKLGKGLHAISAQYPNIYVVSILAKNYWSMEIELFRQCPICYEI